jgi:predicted glycosyltransferase
MNREAAVLGTPAYSLFAGRCAAVDRELERRGRLTFVQSESDLPRIRLEKKGRASPLRNPSLRAEIVDLILDILH